VFKLYYLTNRKKACTDLSPGFLSVLVRSGGARDEDEDARYEDDGAAAAFFSPGMGSGGCAARGRPGVGLWDEKLRLPRRLLRGRGSPLVWRGQGGGASSLAAPAAWVPSGSAPAACDFAVAGEPPLRLLQLRLRGVELRARSQGYHHRHR
jgi:hypothetical protein